MVAWADSQVGMSRHPPSRGKPGGILCADVLHGLVQHIFGQQLLHDGVCQGGEGALCIAFTSTHLLLQPGASMPFSR
jgi:hypothetical protein